MIQSHFIYTLPYIYIYILWTQNVPVFDARLRPLGLHCFINMPEGINAPPAPVERVWFYDECSIQRFFVVVALLIRFVLDPLWNHQPGGTLRAETRKADMMRATRFVFQRPKTTKLVDPSSPRPREWLPNIGNPLSWRFAIYICERAKIPVGFWGARRWVKSGW